MVYYTIFGQWKSETEAKDMEEDNFYSKEVRDDLFDEDELTPEEIGFMEGWEESDEFEDEDNF